MVIDDAYRGQGIGKQLLQNVLIWAKNKGATRAQLLVNRRAILSRLEVETASNSFHLSMSPSSVLTGGIWSVLHGYDL